MIKVTSAGQTLNINHYLGNSQEGYFLGPNFEENTQQGITLGYKNLTLGYSARQEGVDYFVDFKFRNNRFEGFYKEYKNYSGTYEIEPSTDDLTQYPNLSTRNWGGNYIHTFFSDDLLLALNGTLPEPRLVLTPYFRISYGYGELENKDKYDFFGYEETQNLNSYSFHNISSKFGVSLIVPIWKFHAYGGMDLGPVAILQDSGDFFVSNNMGMSGYLGLGLTSRYVFFSMKWIQVDLYNQIDDYYIQFLNGNFKASLGIKI